MPVVSIFRDTRAETPRQLGHRYVGTREPTESGAYDNPHPRWVNRATISP